MDPIIEIFKQEFDRFHSFLMQQADLCPDEETWLEKTGACPYWWHFMHVFAVMEYYTRGTPVHLKAYSRDEVMLKIQPERALTRDETRTLAAAVTKDVYAFFASQTEKTLAARNNAASDALGRELTNLNSLIGLVRHHTYHIGCLDSLLRAKGITGVC